MENPRYNSYVEDNLAESLVGPIIMEKASVIRELFSDTSIKGNRYGHAVDRLLQVETSSGTLADIAYEEVDVPNPRIWFRIKGTDDTSGSYFLELREPGRTKDDHGAVKLRRREASQRHERRLHVPEFDVLMDILHEINPDTLVIEMNGKAERRQTMSQKIAGLFKKNRTKSY